MSEQPLLLDLVPPPGGWERLNARRDTAHPGKGLGLPLATAAVLALATFLLRPQSPEALQLPWDSARLIAQPAKGVGLRHLGGAEVTFLPSTDPQVSFYWVQPAATAPPARSDPVPPR